MKDRRGPGRLVVVVAVVAALAAVGISRSDRATAEATVTVTWSDLVAFNPDVTDYVFSFEGDPSGHYLLRGVNIAGDFGVAHVLPGPGENTAVFKGTGPGGAFTLRLYSCDADFRSCTLVSRSPELSVWRGLRVDHWVERLGPDAPVELETTEPAFLPAVDVAWEVVETGVPVAGGAFTGVPLSGPMPPIGPQPDLVDGRSYEFRMTVSAETATYGRLVTETSRDIVWDTTNIPMLTVEMLRHEFEEQGQPSNVVYPVPDGYGDWLRFTDENDDIGLFSLTIRNSAGDLVATKNGIDFEWNARDDAGLLLPEGTYTARIATRDWAWNEAVVTRKVRISYLRPVRTVWRRAISPAASLGYVPEPECGWLKRPGRRAWPTSFGYRSKAECATVDSFMQTIHEVPVPDSIDDRYGRARLTVVGGATRKAPASRLTFSLTPSALPGVLPEDLAHTFPGSVGRHTSAWESGRIVARGDGRFARWTVASRLGDRYDVRRFVIEIEYDTLG